MSKLGFALKSVYKSIVQSSDCPYCGCRSTALLERKRLVLQLRECQRCKLKFRFPKDSFAENKRMYRSGYRLSGRLDLPSASEVDRQMAIRTPGFGQNFPDHLQTIKGIVPRGKLLDYGSSWGYHVHQFRAAGYDASGFDIAKPQVELGRRLLGVPLSDDIASFAEASFDVIYSAHCLEQIPNPDVPLRQFKKLLKPGGHLFLYVWNCSGAAARAMGVRWGPMIGESHVLALDADFFRRNLPGYGFQIRFASSPYSSSPQSYDAAALDGEELLVVGVREAAARRRASA